MNPWNSLHISKDLACEFFATFARVEYALKATAAYLREDRGRAVPNWIAFQHNVGAALVADATPQVQEAVRYLVSNPPDVQKVAVDRPEFRGEPLAGANDGEKAIEAARRVRNNLFHGGKCMPPVTPDRDENLVLCSLIVLVTCVQKNQSVKKNFEE